MRRETNNKGRANAAAGADDDRLLTPRQAELIDAGVHIADTGTAGETLAFVHSVMCQVGLPRKPVEGSDFLREGASNWLHVQAGYLELGSGKPQLQPVPFGSTPRLVLAALNQQAVRNRSPVVDTGRSPRAFMRSLGYAVSGGRDGTHPAFLAQFCALAACTITLGMRGRVGGTFSGKIIKYVGHIVDDWPREFSLSDDYFNTLTQHAVPLNLRALQALRGSALDIDLYCFFAQRLYRVKGPGELISWPALRGQFGTEYRGRDSGRTFKRRFRESIRRVLTVYPEARVKPVHGGVCLMPSPPPVQRRALR